MLLRNLNNKMLDGKKGGGPGGRREFENFRPREKIVPSLSSAVLLFFFYLEKSFKKSRKNF